MFTCYVLTDESREKLMKKFPPKFEKVFAHHITQDFGVGPDTPIPVEADIRAIGYATDGHDIEAIVVSVDGENTREDGKFYHITWSLNPETKKPVDAGDIIGYGTYQLILPIDLETTPSLEH